MTQEKVIAKVFRYDPAVDGKPYYKTYELDWKPYLSVLEVLVRVYEDYEDVAFDYGCRAVWCGRCGMTVNGKPVLACMTPVMPGEVTIEPLKGFPVVRDMIVDRSKVKAKLHGIMPYLVREKLLEEVPVVAMEAYEKMCGVYRCTECLLCYAVCPAIKDDMNLARFAGPAAMLRIGMRYYDPRDEGDRVKQAVDEGLEHCTMCGLCHKVCYLGMESARDLPNIQGPAGLYYIDHLAILGDLQKAAEERGLLPEKSAPKV